MSSFKNEAEDILEGKYPGSFVPGYTVDCRVCAYSVSADRAVRIIHPNEKTLTFCCISCWDELEGKADRIRQRGEPENEWNLF